MKKTLMLAGALALLAALLAGCAGRADKGAETPLHISLSTIDVEEIYYRPALHGSVAVDRQTGVMYWISESGIATLLVDAKGRPRTWRAEP